MHEEKSEPLKSRLKHDYPEPNLPRFTPRPYCPKMQKRDSICKCIRRRISWNRDTIPDSKQLFLERTPHKELDYMVLKFALRVNLGNYPRSRIRASLI